MVQDTLAELRSITLGGTFGDKVEVTGGVKQGDQVVLTGQLNLINGARVQVIH